MLELRDIQMPLPLLKTDVGPGCHEYLSAYVLRSRAFVTRMHACFLGLQSKGWCLLTGVTTARLQEVEAEGGWRFAHPRPSPGLELRRIDALSGKQLATAAWSLAALVSLLFSSETVSTQLSQDAAVRHQPSMCQQTPR